ncbi:ATP-binding cassette domain-containing protein [Acinetobacter bereziniae]|uniref:ATP-binding cassette domain-containing protein n=1 Tax=Acinetobacter bereziniae TaxID=106648 RepID=UPI0032139EB5
MSYSIRTLNVRENNLKNISLEIPRNKIISISGISGAGKSTLMFDVIITENERRYRIEHNIASEYEVYNRKDFDRLEVLDQIYGVSQKAFKKSEISNVSTVSKLNEHIKEIFIKYGEIICHCGAHVDNSCPLSFFYKIIDKDSLILYKIKERNKEINNANKKIIEDNCLNKYYDSDFKIITGKKLNNSLKMDLFLEIDKSLVNENNIKKIIIIKNGQKIFDFSIQTFCKICYKEYQVKNRYLFTKSELSEHNGRCKSCNGSGNLSMVDFEKLINKNIITDTFLNIPHTGKAYKYIYLQDSEIKKIVGKENFNSSFYDLSPDIRNQLFDLINSKLLSKKENDVISHYIVTEKCKECHGTGYNYKCNAVKYKGLNFYEFNQLQIQDLKDYIEDYKVLKIINEFEKLSLSYLRLSQSTEELSGGELQRLKLIRYLSDDIKNSIIVLDEISSGLARSDLINLMDMIRNLNNNGNTIILIDHSDYVVKCSDYNIHFENNGHKSGYISKNNFYSELTYSRSKKELNNFIVFTGLNKNNLKDIHVNIPLNSLVSIVGVSGSGKSSLVKAIISEIEKNKGEIDVIYASQDDLSKNSRSTIASYTGIFDEIRNYYAQNDLSKNLGFNISHFSFNTTEGSCDLCNGSGIYNDVTCSKCFGVRFNNYSLSVKINGYNIYELLSLPLSKLINLSISPTVNKLCDLLIKMGAGYLTLARITSTLSGGECQRVKLSKYLLKNYERNTHKFIFLDEPTKGLSIPDCINILKLFSDLLDTNCTIISVEHNDMFIDNSDYIIEIGPKSGVDGGELIFQGKQEEFRKKEIPVNKNYPISILNNSNLICNQWQDDLYFDNIRNYFNNFEFRSTENLTIYNNFESLKSCIKDKRVFFCPFIDDIYNNGVISKSKFQIIIGKLLKIGVYCCLWNNNVVNLKSLKPTFSQDLYFDFFCEIDDIDLAFVLGGNALIVFEDGMPWFHSLRIIDYKNKLIGTKFITKNTFNKYFSQCQYCGGAGKILDVNNFISNFSTKITDISFYKSSIINEKNLYNIRKSIKKFKDEMICNLDVNYSTLTDIERLNAVYGFKKICFVNDGDRKNALSDQIKWEGLVELLNNDKNKQSCKCIKCNGTGYIKELNYYLINGKPVYAP